MFVTVDSLGYKKQKNGDQEIILYTALIALFFQRSSLLLSTKGKNPHKQFSVVVLKDI